MNSKFAKYRFDGNGVFDISNHHTSPEEAISKKASKKILAENIDELHDIQEGLYASSKKSVLIVLQAMDAAGKDGTLRRVFSGINPQGCSVHSFKKPTPEEVGHDFLWRINKVVPQKGMISIFNRSHYEEVLVTRVHPSYILYQNIPGIEKVEDIKNEFWQDRFDRIRNYEDHLAKSGTIILKFFLNVSLEAQKGRMIDRMENPGKHWKFNLNDLKERQHWPQYQSAYQDAIQNTGTENAPWYVIPADDKPTMRALVSSIVLEELRKHNFDYPNAGQDILADIKEANAILNSEG